MERKSGSLFYRFAIIFAIAAAITVAVGGAYVYAYQYSLYENECELKARNIGDYLSQLMGNEKDQFKAVQKWLIERRDEISIPVNFIDPGKDGEKFQSAFYKEYPERTFGKDVKFGQMPDKLKDMYAIYWFERWQVAFEEARSAFDVPYTYYCVPAEDDNVYYIFDMTRRGRNGKEGNYELPLGSLIKEDRNERAAMWETWEKGKAVEGRDFFNNERGVTLSYYEPFIVKGQISGIIGVDVDVTKMRNQIKINAVKQCVGMSAVLILAFALLLWHIHNAYIKRLSKLESDVKTYSETKDVSIANAIEKDEDKNDEIASLAIQVSSMMHEIKNYTDGILKQARELMETKEQASELDAILKRDQLTGIRGKAACEKEIMRLDEYVKDKTARFGIAIADLNGLRKINEEYGREKGNEAIITLCQKVCKIFDHSPVFRTGSNEFTVILEHDDYTNAAKLIKIFNSDIGSKKEVPWEKASASIGMARFEYGKDKTAEDVVEKAKTQMLKEKRIMKSHA